MNRVMGSNRNKGQKKPFNHSTGTQSTDRVKDFHPIEPKGNDVSPMVPSQSRT